MPQKCEQNNIADNTQGSRKVTQSNCKYCSNIHEPCTCPAYYNYCAKCRREHHFDQLCRSQCRFVKRWPHRKAQNSSQCGQDTEETEVATKELNTVRANIFNFHNVRSETIAKLKPKSNQKHKHMNTKQIHIVMTI